MRSAQLKHLSKYSRCLLHTHRSTLSNFQHVFSKENSLNSVKSFKSFCPRLNIDGKRQAAVLIPLCVVNDEVSLLYTLRTNKLKRNSGQVSFPGGMRETNEELQDTALRESCEELGLTKTSIDVWGSGRFLVSRDVAIMPFLANIGAVKPDQLNINHEETTTKQVSGDASLHEQIQKNMGHDCLHDLVDFKICYTERFYT